MAEENSNGGDKKNLTVLIEALRDYGSALKRVDEQAQRGALMRMGHALDAIPVVNRAAMLAKRAAGLVGFDPSEWVYVGRGKLKRVVDPKAQPSAK